jgi:hypothetical protein
MALPVEATDQARYSSGLYAWLAEREERAASHPGFVLPARDNGTAYHGYPDRLATLRAGCGLKIAVADLPAHARIGLASHWWNRATVSPDGTIALSDDDGHLWLTEEGL